MDDLLRERGYRPDFPLEFVKYGQYSPHSSEKSGSAPRPLATATLLGQPPGLVPITCSPSARRDRAARLYDNPWVEAGSAQGATGDTADARSNLTAGVFEGVVLAQVDGNRLPRSGLVFYYRRVVPPPCLLPVSHRVPRSMLRYPVPQPTPEPPHAQLTRVSSAGLALVLRLIHPQDPV